MFVCNITGRSNSAGGQTNSHDKISRSGSGSGSAANSSSLEPTVRSDRRVHKGKRAHVALSPKSKLRRATAFAHQVTAPAPKSARRTVSSNNIDDFKTEIPFQDINSTQRPNSMVRTAAILASMPADELARLYETVLAIVTQESSAPFLRSSSLADSSNSSSSNNSSSNSRNSRMNQDDSSRNASVTIRKHKPPHINSSPTGRAVISEYGSNPTESEGGMGGSKATGMREGSRAVTVDESGDHLDASFSLSIFPTWNASAVSGATESAAGSVESTRSMKSAEEPVLTPAGFNSPHCSDGGESEDSKDEQGSLLSPTSPLGSPMFGIASWRLPLSPDSDDDP